MQIKIKNLGALEQAEFSLGDMTIICGCNNTGKTYATYALYGFLFSWRQVINIKIDSKVIDELLTGGTVNIDLKQYVSSFEEIIADGCRAYIKDLPQVFASPAEHFKESEFYLTIKPDEIKLDKRFERTMKAGNADVFLLTKEKKSAELFITLLVEKEGKKIPPNAILRVISDSIKDIIFGHLFPNPFIASAERTGAAIFRNELNLPKNRIMEEINKNNKKINPIELLFKVYEDYALPVKADIDFNRQIESISKMTSFIAEKHPEIISSFADIIGGKYTVIKKTDQLYYEPFTQKSKKVKLTLDESSSAVRSLLDVGFYLSHIAKPGDLLIVDEPELNLHPENQRRVARLFASLVNLGIKVFITTHSDYIIKELNTLIMLKQNKTYLKEIAEREGYNPNELISPEKIKVFIAEKALAKINGAKRQTKIQTLIQADITPELGIEVRSFDKTIDTMNRIQDEIIWGDENE